jgi:hypothetical protein
VNAELPINALQKFLAGLPFGFITANQMPDLIALDRLHPVLVRCGGGRFTCGAQDVAHFIKCVEAGGDYVRDVCVPAGSIERAAAWVAAPSVAKCVHQAANTKAAGLLGTVPDKVKSSRAPAWDESQCGGVFDGRQVTSDADPGL